MIYDVQKASMLKRFSAYLFDLILLAILAVGVAFVLSAALGYETTIDEREKLRDEYEQKYGVEFDITQDDYDKMTEDEKKVYTDAYGEFVKDPEVNTIDMLLINLSLLILSFATLVPYILLELVVPSLFKHGQTLGKKIFGIAVMRVDGVRISTFQLFVRTVLGKYTMETMLPILLILLYIFNFMPLVSIIALPILLIVQFICVVATKLHTPIHELLSATVSVDLASQLIFDSPEELMEYKKKLHAEAAEKALYK